MKLVPEMIMIFLVDYGDHWEFDIVVMHGSEESTTNIEAIECKGETLEYLPGYGQYDFKSYCS